MLPINIELPENFLAEEIRCNYVITKEYKELWAVELDLLDKFDKVCKKLGIRYLSCAGTMLGAVRHKGMIPWDDDIDVMMMREDYEILCKNADCFQHPYFFQTEFTDKGCLRGHAQLRNSMTTGILVGELKGRFSFNQGIFIDIFPLDNVPDDETERKKYLEKIVSLRTLMFRLRNIGADPCEASSSTLKRMVKSLLWPIVSALERRFNISHILYKKFEKLLIKYNNEKTQEVCILATNGTGKRCILYRNYIEGALIIVPFEMLKVPVPIAYDKILTIAYNNWHEMKRGGSIHGGLVFDAHKSYKDYFKDNL